MARPSTRSHFWNRVCSLIWLPYAFRSGIRMKKIDTGTFTAELPFGGAGNRELLEIKLMLLLASFVFAYFKFTWSLRQFNLLSILVGAAPLGKAGEPDIDTYAHRLAGANNLAGDDFNRGIRAYYFGLAASGWLLNPIALAVLALAVLIVLYRRDYRSSALYILRDRP